MGIRSFTAQRAVRCFASQEITDCHNQSADWFRNDEEGIAKYESFNFLHYNGYLHISVNKLLIVSPKFVNRQVFLAKMPD